MERYFTVTDESRLHKEWFDYKENMKLIREMVRKFKSENGIEANEYYAADDALYIVPSENDAESFKSLLGMTNDNGLRKFKATTKIGKAWVRALKDAELSVVRKPMVILYFKSYGGKFRSRLFDQDGVLYCSLEPVAGEIPVGFIEMKASEFFKIIEESKTVTA